MVAELLLNELTVEIALMPLCLCFGVAYVLFHTTLRFELFGSCQYFFLNWQAKHAYGAFVALLLVLATFYALAVLMCKMRSNAWASLLLVVVSLSMMQLRPPPAYRRRKQGEE